jgi:hypothetical protein
VDELLPRWTIGQMRNSYIWRPEYLGHFAEQTLAGRPLHADVDGPVLRANRAKYDGGTLEIGSESLSLRLVRKFRNVQQRGGMPNVCSLVVVVVVFCLASATHTVLID